MPDLIRLQQEIAALFSTALHVHVPAADTDLFDTRVIDSLAFVELLVNLEATFGIKIPMEEIEIEHFRSVANIAKFLAGHLKEVPPAIQADGVLPSIPFPLRDHPGPMEASA